MKKKILILFSIITLLCSGCGLSTVYTDMPATIDEGLDDKTSDIVGAWYGRDGDISGIYYMYSNGIGEVIAFKHNHNDKTTSARFKYSYHPKTGLLTIDVHKDFKSITQSSIVSFSDDKKTMTMREEDNKTSVFTRIE